MTKPENTSLETIQEMKKGFYEDEDFHSVFNPRERKSIIRGILEQLKSSDTRLGDKKTMLQYLDAQVGDVPKAGPDSGIFKGVIRVVYDDRPPAGVDDE